ncbi:hypothetical protein L950_0211930 [Sphingobacterium sp. IITKGP-BTPF85]|nr:hypothetical protein L950_0211930 [Sphingobacterium sp. IITKGP-BTPF85]
MQDCIRNKNSYKKFSAEVFDSKGIEDDWGNATSSCFPIPYIGHDEYISDSCLRSQVKASGGIAHTKHF